MAQQIISRPPVDNQLYDASAKLPPSIWARWFVSVQSALNNLCGSLGIGNGANVNIQAPTQNTGTGPANPNLVVQWRQEVINGVTYWRPLFQ